MCFVTAIESLDLLGLRDAKALRSRVNSLRRGIDYAWVQLGGLSVDEAANHGALLAAITRWGLGNATEFDAASMPRLAVLDWSACAECSADGLALMPLLTAAIVERGAQVVVCEPIDPRVAAFVREAGLRAACQSVLTVSEQAKLVWIPATGSLPAAHGGSSRRRARAVLPVVAVSPADGRAQVGAFVDSIAREFRSLGLPQSVVVQAADATVELVQNVLAYSNSRFMALAAVLWMARRPRVLQVAVVDAGVGIGPTIAADPGRGWLRVLPESRQAAVVLDHSLSSRAVGSGGGMSRIMRILVDEAGAEVRVRTGTGRVIFGPSTQSRLETLDSTYGWGTQVRFDLRL